MLKVFSKSALCAQNHTRRVFYRFALLLFVLTLFFGGIGGTNASVRAAGFFGAGGNANAAAFAGGLYDSPEDSFAWSGFNSSDWHTAENWFDGVVPASGADVRLPLRHVRHETVISDADVTVNNLTLAPYRTITVANNRTLTINGLLTMDDGNITVSPGSRLILGANAAIVRGSGYIIGEVRKVFSGADAFTFPVGTDSGFSPVDVANVAGAGSLTVKANEGFLAGVDASQSVRRSWTLAADGVVSADVTFAYPDADVPEGADEANFKFVARGDSINAEFAPTFFDTTANTFTLNGVETFSEWSLGRIGASPLDADVTVSGRAVGAGDRGISNAIVTLTNAYGYPREVRTNSFGEFRFDEVNVGQTYIVSISAKGYTFSPNAIPITVKEEIDGLIFNAQSQ